MRVAGAGSGPPTERIRWMRWPLWYSDETAKDAARAAQRMPVEGGTRRDCTPRRGLPSATRAAHAPPQAKGAIRCRSSFPRRLDRGPGRPKPRRPGGGASRPTTRALEATLSGPVVQAKPGRTQLLLPCLRCRAARLGEARSRLSVSVTTAKTNRAGMANGERALRASLTVTDVLAKTVVSTTRPALAGHGPAPGMCSQSVFMRTSSHRPNLVKSNID